MKKPVYYMQNDPKWGGVPYTIDGDVKTETIGKSGCGPTCMAMILAEWIDPKITPKEACKMAIDMKDRTANSGTEWEFFKHVADKYGMQMKQTGKTAEVVSALQAGNTLVVCSMGPDFFTKKGHYILAYDVKNGEILVNDPASTIRNKARIEIFMAQAKQYFIFYRPVPNNAAVLEALKSNGVITNEGYWLKRILEDKSIADLLMNMYNYIKKGGNV